MSDLSSFIVDMVGFCASMVLIISAYLYCGLKSIDMIMEYDLIDDTRADSIMFFELFWVIVLGPVFLIILAIYTNARKED